MIEIKKMFEEDSFDICGYYSDGHVDKEEFVDIVENISKKILRKELFI